MGKLYHLASSKQALVPYRQHKPYLKDVNTNLIERSISNRATIPKILSVMF